MKTGKQPQLDLLDSIRAAIDNDNRSLRELAKLADTSHSTLSRFRSGDRSIPGEVLNRLASVLGVVVKAPRPRKPN